jgi:hypothetical protein
MEKVYHAVAFVAALFMKLPNAGHIFNELALKAGHLLANAARLANRQRAIVMTLY